MLKIAKILMNELSERLKEKNIRLKFDKEVIQFIKDKGTNL